MYIEMYMPNLEYVILPNCCTLLRGGENTFNVLQALGTFVQSLKQRLDILYFIYLRAMNPVWNNLLIVTNVKQNYCTIIMLS